MLIGSDGNFAVIAAAVDGSVHVLVGANQKIKKRGRGGARKGAGRKPGLGLVMPPVPLTTKVEFQAHAFEYAVEAFNKLVELMRTSSSEKVQALAAEKVLDRAVGKAPQVVDITAIKHTEIVYESAAKLRQALLDRGVPRTLLDMRHVGEDEEDIDEIEIVDGVDDVSADK